MNEPSALSCSEAVQILQRHWDTSFRSRARQVAIGVGTVIGLPLLLLALPFAYVANAIRKIFQRRSESEPARAVQIEGNGECKVRYSIARVRFLTDSQESMSQSWLISFSKEFMKQIRSIDRKLQGRVLDAISEIASSPCVVIGDTRKPLQGELRGSWRYRIGDYRLVYRPDESKQTVHLVAFGSRGGIYGE